MCETHYVKSYAGSVLEHLPLVIAYIVPVDTASTAHADVMKTMLPEPDAFRRGCVSCPRVLLFPQKKKFI